MTVAEDRSRQVVAEELVDDEWPVDVVADAEGKTAGGLQAGLIL